jgi:hypothetical protein
MRICALDYPRIELSFTLAKTKFIKFISSSPPVQLLLWLLLFMFDVTLSRSFQALSRRFTFSPSVFLLEIDRWIGSDLESRTRSRIRISV